MSDKPYRDSPATAITLDQWSAMTDAEYASMLAGEYGGTPKGTDPVAFEYGWQG